MSAQELLDRPPTPLTPLSFLGHEGIFHEHLTHLVASDMHAGKTSLLSHVVIPWLRLGMTICWVTEESPLVWEGRCHELRSLYGQHVPWDHLQFRPSLGRDPSMLLRHARESPTDILILDTIRNAASIEDENDAASIRRGLAPWLHLATSRHQTLIALHHLRKSGGSHGQGISGSAALPALFDTVLELRRVDGNDDRREVRGIARHADVPTLVTERRDDGSMIVLGDARRINQIDLRTHACDILSASDKPLTTSQISKAWSGPPPNVRALQRALESAAHDHLIQRDPPINESAERKTIRWSTFFLDLG